MTRSAPGESSQHRVGRLPDSAVALHDPVTFAGEHHLPLAPGGDGYLGYRKAGGHRGLRSTTRSPSFVAWTATAPFRSSSSLAREISSSGTPCARASCASLATEGGRAIAESTSDAVSAGGGGEPSARAAARNFRTIPSLGAISSPTTEIAVAPSTSMS